MKRAFKSALCVALGHHWVARDEIQYEQARTDAFVAGVLQEVGVTWVSDEVCSRCGAETWWPA